jgi:hypothetical protein
VVCIHIASGHGGYGFLALCSSVITFCSEYICIVRIYIYAYSYSLEISYSKKCENLPLSPPDIPNLATAT